MTDPADETGWCLTTLHEYASGTLNVSGFAATSDGSYVYLGGTDTGNAVGRVDTSDFSIDDTWAVCADSVFSIAIIGDGTLFALVGDGTVAKITSAGSVTDAYGTLPVGWSWTFLTCGADGLLYATVYDDNGYPAVVTIDPSDGTITDIAALHLGAMDPEFLDYATATSDGTVWVSLRNNGATVSTLRRLSGGVVTDIGIQDVETVFRDHASNAKGVFVDDQDRLIVPMETNQAGLHRYGAFGINEDAWGYYGGVPSGAWSVTGGTVTGSSSTGVTITPDPGETTLVVSLPAAYSLPYYSNHFAVQAGVSSDPAIDAFSAEMRVYDETTLIESDSQGPVSPGGGLSFSITHDSDDNTQPVVHIGFEWTITDILDTNNYFVDFVGPIALVTAHTPPELSWFLHVDSDGTATRISSTWDYFSSPGPQTNRLDRYGNIADGPLTNALACRVESNMLGQSADRKTFYFGDAADSVPVLGGTQSLASLLRKLATCAARRGILVGSVAA